MTGISKETQMIIASNLTIAAAIMDAAMAMKSGPQTADSKELVTRRFSTILTNLEQQPLGNGQHDQLHVSDKVELKRRDL
jgi:hypothetical protein